MLILDRILLKTVSISNASAWHSFRRKHWVTCSHRWRRTMQLEMQLGLLEFRHSCLIRWRSRSNGVLKEDPLQRLRWSSGVARQQPLMHFRATILLLFLQESNQRVTCCMRGSSMLRTWDLSILMSMAEPITEVVVDYSSLEATSVLAQANMEEWQDLRWQTSWNQTLTRTCSRRCQASSLKTRAFLIRRMTLTLAQKQMLSYHWPRKTLRISYALLKVVTASYSLWEPRKTSNATRSCPSVSSCQVPIPTSHPCSTGKTSTSSQPPPSSSLRTLVKTPQ